MPDRTKLLVAANAALLALVIAAPAIACLWDRDTLKAEADGLPGVVEAIVGRFPRPPDLYYQMRLDRVTGELQTDPTQLALYDDAGVACDRLGRSDEAIEWMARKRAQLDQLDSTSVEVAEHEYRYLANLGTFHAHRWFSGGANRDDLTDMERARELIDAAIELNPDAHFGREKYQLLAIEFILKPPTIDSDWYVPTLLDSALEYPMKNAGFGLLVRSGFDDAAEGLSGLVRLGNAWRSFDVFYALAHSLDDNRHASLAKLAALRCAELAENGAESIHPAATSPDMLLGTLESLGFSAENHRAIESYFRRAREHADELHNARHEFVLAKLNAGEHPDTHANFWDGFKEPKPPSLPNGVLGLSSRTWTNYGAYAAIVILPILGLVAYIRLRKWLKRRKLQLASA